MASQRETVRMEHGEARSITSSHSSGTPPMEAGGHGANRVRRCNVYEGNAEARGWAIDSITRGVVLIGPIVFLSTALIRLAKEAAGCVVDVPEGETEAPECNKRVYGIKPSSLLTFYSLVVGLSSATLMPIAGAIIDHTRHRRTVGRASALVMTAIIFAQIFINENTWFAVAILQIFSLFLHYVRTLCVFAYLPELTNDQNTLVRWTASFSIVQYISMVLFLIVMVGLLAVTGIKDEVTAARFSQALVFVITVSTLGYSWIKLFGARPASQRVPEGQTLLSAGFRKLFNTIVGFRSTNPALMWFLVALSFADGAMLSVSVILITYTTEELQFTSKENGIAILILLLSSVPGSLVSTRFAQKYNPIRSLQSCYALAIVNSVLAALVLVRPGQQAALYGVATGWGIATGWKYPTEKVIYCSLIPPNQDAEFMGLFMFVGQALSWLPPLIFTAMNEAGVPMRAGVASLGIFFAGSLLILFLVRDYDGAVERAKRSGQNDELGEASVEISCSECTEHSQEDDADLTVEAPHQTSTGSMDLSQNS